VIRLDQAAIPFTAKRDILPLLDEIDHPPCDVDAPYRRVVDGAPMLSGDGPGSTGKGGDRSDDDPAAIPAADVVLDSDQTRSVSLLI